MDYHDRCATGAANTGLDKLQRQKLAVTASDAWVACGRPYYTPEIDGQREGMTRTEAFDFWRHTVAKEKIGRESFRAMTQHDFAPLMAEFSRLAGKLVQAEYWANRAVTEPNRQALAILRREMERATSVLGNPLGYVATIALSRYKSSDLSDLSEKQIWNLVFDVRRAVQRKRKAAEVADAPF